MKRAAKIAAIVVLVAAPTSYVVVAAVQSVGGSDNKERVAAATEPLPGWPNTATRNIYDVPLVKGTKGNAYFETNSWKTSSLYVRFQTTAHGLAGFLARLGIGREDLGDGTVPITRKQQKTFGWRFHGPWSKHQRLAGVTLPAERKGLAEHRIVVNLADKARPTVYLVSTVTY